MGKQVLVLLPEIALSAEWLNRFEARFGVRPAEWHSELKPRRRRHTWRQVGEGKVRVLVGARSALYLPFPNLGLIVVDEEHESAYKQEEGVIYHGRDMAVVRASLTPCPVVLVSATPALETMRNVENGRYSQLRLTARHGVATLPSVELVDLRRHQPARGAVVVPAADRCDHGCAGCGRAVAGLPQSPWLCAAHALPGLRTPAGMPQLLRLAGRAPVARPPAMSSLRP